MELIITEKLPTICLNMIVKDESHIILTTLEKLCNKIKFDYWVICDTGSSDNTPKLITDFFEKKGIKGELFYDEWTNFAHNRTLALERAYTKTDLLLVFDADDELVGDIEMPFEVLFDEYQFYFGSSADVSYTRTLMINNHKKFEYQSIIHEFISCKEGPSRTTVVKGKYHVVSGRAGNRNRNPNKYLNDALVLENAYAEALKKNDQLFHRYAFYCANSYKDHGKIDDAIKWYKITINHPNQWAQEKYCSCLYLYECYEKLDQKENGFFYLVKAFNCDNERVECLYPLLVHYCCENMHKVAYNYYLNIKDFFENSYLNVNMSNKLFIRQDKYNFFVPYYMILIADKVQDFSCVVKMYEIVFIKKQRMFEEWYIKNFLYNLQFFLGHVPKNNNTFIDLANDYLKFIHENGVKLHTFDFLLKDVYNNAGLLLKPYIIKEITNNTQKFSKDVCVSSKNILIYTGFSDFEWNYTYMQNNALGGSEKAVIYISQCFPKEFNIYISGHVGNEKIDNIQYIHLNELSNLIRTTPFHTVIVSRYISFYEMFKECSFYQSFIWAHDISLLPYGCDLNDTQIITKWNSYINGCICLTEWHKNKFITTYPLLKDKISLINNGLDVTSFNIIDTNKKIKNKFIYSSRPDRGLNRLLDLWPSILEKFPDATLSISSYGDFPSNPEEVILKNIINNNNSIKFLGKLNVEQLYNEMETSEYWLYPTHWPETSCITALEMLMSEVICLYYPISGLTNTMSRYGIQITPGSEIDAICCLTDDIKICLRQTGRAYAEQCSWKNRYNTWHSLLSLKQKETILFILPIWYNPIPLEDYFISLTYTFNINIIVQGQELKNFNINQAIFICIISDNKLFSLLKEHKIDICLLNTEPMNINFRLDNLKRHIPSEIDKNIKIYDYSLSNIKILNKEGYLNTQHLEYCIYEKENTFLKNIYENTHKEYDFGIISYENPIILKKRKKVVEFLINQKYSVNIIHGWREQRDIELSKCSIILNIHGQCGDFESQIFEHIRCDRLLAAGFNILSEDSYLLDEEFIQKYPNLKLIPFIDFFNMDFYNNLTWLKKTDKTIKIIDCFTFYNELNMLKYRLNVLNNVVDYFILVEANQTHVGKPKKNYFEENKQMFEQFNDKIIHIVVDLPFNETNINISNNDQWTNEKHQRNCIKDGIVSIKDKLTNNDYIIISDVDEIPDPNMLVNIKNKTLNICDINSFSQDFYYYNLNNKRNEKWTHSKILSYKKYKELNTTCDNLRFYNSNILINGGWHLSYFGDANFIKNKLENFAHQEYNSDRFTNTNTIENIIKNNLDLFSRDKHNHTNRITLVPTTENDYLPPLYEKYLSSFYNEHKPKIYCFIHSGTFINNGTKILDYIINVIEKTGFINIVENVFINNVGTPIENKYNNKKYIITNYPDNTYHYETVTLNNIHDFSRDNPNNYILYLHTKGVSYNSSDNIFKNISDWVNLMLFFLVEKYDDCMKKLDEGYDTIGCNYLAQTQTHSYPKHYSGNFWWAKTNYLNKLEKLKTNNNNFSYNKVQAEFWLFTKEPNYYNIYSSTVDHYIEQYPINLYSKNSIIEHIYTDKIKYID